MAGRLLLTIAALAFLGCRRENSSDFFPIGIYGVNEPSPLERLREAGFDAIQTADPSSEALIPLAKASRRLGMRLAASPEQLMSSRPASEFPGTIWYLADEPDVNKIAPQALKELDGKVRRWSPGAPTTFVVGDGRQAARFSGSGSVMMVDWYPVPHLPLESLGEHVRLTVEAAGERPVWAVIQAFDWKEYAQRSAAKPRIGRFPRAAEIRFMSYDAVLQGARGLWYYVYIRPSGKTLADAPEDWSAVTQVSREMAAMKAIFRDGSPIPLPFMPTPDGVAARAWRYHGREYVVIENRRAGFNLRAPDELLEGRWRPLAEPRRDARELLDKYMGAYYLPPYRVMVFERRLGGFGG